MVQKLPTMKITQSSIQLHDMRFYAYHGVMEQERRVGGQYLVTLCVKSDLSRAVVSDSVADTVNYAALYEVVAREMAQPSRHTRSIKLYHEIHLGRISRQIFQDLGEVEILMSQKSGEIGKTT